MVVEDFSERKAASPPVAAPALPIQLFLLIVLACMLKQCVILGILILCSFKLLLGMMNAYLATVFLSDCDNVVVGNQSGMDGTGGGSIGDGEGSELSSNMNDSNLKIVDPNLQLFHSVSGGCGEISGGGECARQNDSLFDRMLVLSKTNHFSYNLCQVSAAGYLFLIITRVCITRQRVAMVGILIMIAFNFITWMMSSYLSILLSGDGSLGQSGSEEVVDLLSDRENSGNGKHVITYENVSSDSEDDDCRSDGTAGDPIEHQKHTTPELLFRVHLKSGGATSLGATARDCGKKGHMNEDSQTLPTRDIDNNQKSPLDETIDPTACAAADFSALKNDPTMSVPLVDLNDQPEINIPNADGQGRGGGSDGPSIAVDESDEEGIRRERIARLRDEGRTFYINEAYRDSVMCYTEAIRLQTSQIYRSKDDAILAALYGNRAAALLMTGAYEGSSADCERALLSIDADSSYAYENLESGPAFRSKILCRKARALLNAGNFGDAEKAFNNSIESAMGALAIVGHQVRPGTGGIATATGGEMQGLEKILNKTISDATVGLLDVKEYRDAIECANDIGINKGFNHGADQKVGLQLLMSINSALSISPGSIELHERKVNVLASLKRWAELASHCERLAVETVKFEGLFSDDLASLNPLPNVRPAQSLKAAFFETNSRGLIMKKLSRDAVCEAVTRLPNGILPMYLRSLRLEERFVESESAMSSIEAYMTETHQQRNRGYVSMSLLSTERDKLRRTLSWKETGDTLFRSGAFEQAAEKYAQCLTIDNDLAYNHTLLVNENAGGRLHAVLHCNRAACFMTLKKYREAVKECTAALHIHTHYMKAMLRRGRCFARTRQYEEAIAEYERYIQLVIEARKSPQTASNSNAACTFDRPIDITEAEYNKAKQELVEVKKSMRNAAAQDQQVGDLRDEGRASYLDGAYLDSVMCYTEAIRMRTTHLIDSTNDEILAALYGNRAAALIMMGAYEAASADCDRASLAVDSNSPHVHESTKCSPSFQSKISCRMARALLKAGKISNAEKAFNCCIQIAMDALGTVERQSQSVGAKKMRDMETILNKRISDAKLGLSDIKTYKDAAESANTMEKSADQLLLSLNSALFISPGSLELHERKVNVLASSKRWAELANHCERLAAESVKLDGLFSDDFASSNPFPDVRPARSLKADFFERNPDDQLDPASMRILSPKAVCEAVVRMPNRILPLYLRALRLEERFAEAEMAVSSIEAYMTETEHRGDSGNMSTSLLSSEKDKLLRTKSLKLMGDKLFSSGDYELAGEKYLQCLMIDNNNLTYSIFFLNENAGGRLHAVLHCNRAACLMAINKYREAVKECTAALRIHTHYMKALLRRGRCFAKILKYEEAIADYERYIQLVNEARKSPMNASKNCSAACTFDRPIDVTEAEYSKAEQELIEAKKAMRNAAEEREQQYHQQQRRQNHYYQQQHHNHYEQYHSHHHYQYQNHFQHHYRQQQQQHQPPPHHQQQQQQQPPPPISKPTDAVDHYQVLGLLPSATVTEIKKAYHKCALKYHPDKNSEEDAAEMFRRAKLAYDVLGDEQSRVAYDSLRQTTAR